MATDTNVPERGSGQESCSPAAAPSLIDKVLEILRNNRLAAVATVDPNGWPHCTMIGIANEQLRIYFAIARTSQKLADIRNDARISLAIGRDVIDPASIHALAIKARATIVDDRADRRKAIQLLLDKRPALKRLEEPNEKGSAIIVAVPEEVRLLDYSKGYGHSTLIRVDAAGANVGVDRQIHDWGYGRDFKPVS